MRINISNPRQIFLLDGLGAMLTAFLLGVVWTRLETLLGIPSKVLYLLAIVACVYACYAIYCYFLVRKSWRPCLKIIAFANILYCCLTVGVMYRFYQNFSLIGWGYFLGELMVLGTFIFIELYTAFYTPIQKA